MTFKNWCEAIKWWLKENKNIDISYVREKIWSELYNKYTYELGYMSSIWWYMTNKFISDFKVDWYIDANYNWKERKKYGHCFTNYNAKKNEIDNYVRKFWDTNQRVNEKQKDFIKNWYYFAYWYFLFCGSEIKIDKQKAKERIWWEYRKLAWPSFINNPTNLIKTIREWSYDEATACIEIIVNRKIKQK